VIARYARIELLVCDLCRDGDYADIDLASAVDALVSLRFLLVVPAGLSA